MLVIVCECNGWAICKTVCFFDDLLTMLFGGVLPYIDRVDRVAQTILGADADIVCLHPRVHILAFEFT